MRRRVLMRVSNRLQNRWFNSKWTIIHLIAYRDPFWNIHRPFWFHFQRLRYCKIGARWVTTPTTPKRWKKGCYVIFATLPWRMRWLFDGGLLFRPRREKTKRLIRTLISSSDEKIEHASQKNPLTRGLCGRFSGTKHSGKFFSVHRESKTPPTSSVSC